MNRSARTALAVALIAATHVGGETTCAPLGLALVPPSPQVHGPEPHVAVRATADAVCATWPTSPAPGSASAWAWPGA
jgi:hypothetical protein